MNIFDKIIKLQNVLRGGYILFARLITRSRSTDKISQVFNQNLLMKLYDFPTRTIIKNENNVSSQNYLSSEVARYM